MSYLSAGADEETSLEQRQEARADVQLQLQRERVSIQREMLKAKKRETIVDGIQTAVLIALPIAAFLGWDRWFKKKKAGGSHAV